MSATAFALDISARPHDLGGGFQVARLLPFRKRRMVGPFVFFDHMGPMDLAAGIAPELDVRPHPHIGLSTVTYLFSGALTHRDSLGFQQEIQPGAVNWMTAGRGITHSERLEFARAHGAHMNGIQAWVALPDEAEECAPSFSHHAGAAALPEFDEGGVQGRLLAGASAGLQAQVPTHSPLFYWHWQMQAGARHSLGADYSERALYVASGAVEVTSAHAGDSGRLAQGQMRVLAGQATADVRALEPSVVMLLGGEPVGERFIDWNFVSSSQERLAQARADWQAGRMKLPVGDEAEWVAYP